MRIDKIADLTLIPLLLISLTIFFVVCCCSCNLISTRFDPSRTADAEKKIASDPAYREMDEICKSITLPPDTEFVGKARLFNSVGIMYFYWTKAPTEQVARHFDDAMKQQGWSPVENDLISFVMSYRKDDKDVNITIGVSDPDNNLALTCMRTRSR